MDRDFVPLSERMQRSADTQTPLRKHWKSSSESSGEYDGPIVEIESFRGGFPKPLPQTPVQVSAVPLNRSRISAWTRCMNNALKICQEARLDLSEVNILMCKGTMSTQAVPTIFITVPSDRQKQDWKPILITIGYMLHAEGCLDLSVEITCAQSPQQNKIFPIKSDHYLVTFWPQNLLKPVIDILKNLELKFLAIEVYEYGPTKEDAQPTVLITTLDEEQAGWNEARNSVHRWCLSRGVDMLVEIIQSNISGRITSYNTKTATGGTKCRVHVPQAPMGISIGVEPEGVGTLGGYLKLHDSKTGILKVAALTNYHVVRGSVKDWPAGEFSMSLLVFRSDLSDAALDEGTQSAWHWPMGHENVQCPAQADHNSEIKELEVAVQEARTTFDSSPIKFKVENGSPSRQQQKNYNGRLKEIHDMENRINTCKNINEQGLLLGRVLLASGYKKAGDCALDWALVEVNSERVGGNLVSHEFFSWSWLFMN